MKHKTIFILLALLGCVWGTHAEDWTQFSLKGKVVKSVITDDNNWLEFQAEFSPEGELQDMHYQDVSAKYGNALKLAIENKNKYYKADLENGMISSLQFEDTYGSWEVLFYYGQNELLSKITNTIRWTTSSVEHVKASAQMNEYAAKIRSLKAELAKLTPGTPAYNQKMAEYQAAAEKASVNTSKSQNIVHTQAHTYEGPVKTFSDYEFDDFGNWTKRKVTVNGETYFEYQSITYEPEFYCTHQWAKIEKSGSLDDVAAFYDDEETTPAYRDKAEEYWNARILNEVFNTCGDQLDCLVRTASESICSGKNQETIMDTVRSRVYRQKVLKERDYKALKELVNWQIDSVSIFNSAYQDSIMARSEKMFNDSVVYLRNKITGHLAAKEYEQARETALQAQEVSPVFSGELAEAEYQLLMIKKENKTVTLDDCEQYRKNNPGSVYDGAVAELYNRLYIRENRGRFLRFGVGGDVTFGKGMNEAGLGVDLIFGWHYSLVNFYTGIHYGGFYVMSSNKSDSESSSQSKGGHFSGQHVTVPLVLRINFGRSFTKNYYVGVGMNMNFATSGYLGYETDEGTTLHFKDRKFYRGPVSLTPRVSIGYSGNKFELELYGLCEVRDVLNKDLIYSTISSSHGYKFDMDKIDSQIRHRFRAGFAVRYIF